MVGYGKPWDFKPDLLTMLGSPVACPGGGTCPEQPCKQYVTLCGKCYRFDVPANIHYGYVGRVAMFSLQELLTGASAAQVFHDLHFDPPEDAAAIKTGWAALNQGLCGAVAAYDAQLSKEEHCATCPVQGNP